tara:strand:+ start:25898 stop:27661 length:1764 start_codon:yes stop_codon:yes gene_type:complete
MNSEFEIVNLAAYQTPEIVEDPQQDFISFGEDNNYYQELIDAYLNSATTSSIITGIANQIYGKGISAHNVENRADDFLAFKNLFKKSCIKKVCLDLKLLGEAAFQVTYKNKKIVSVTHFNRETLRAEKSDKKTGKINAYYYHPKWKDYEHEDELTRIPVFGSNSPNEIYIIRRFIPGMHYYSPPDWSSALNYSKLECDISEYLVNEVSHSFSGTKLVSFSNGVPTEEKKLMIKNEVMNKLTGVNGEKVIISFSDSPENKTTIEDISVSDAADVYSYIAEECSRKLLLANRITSPLLIGVRDTGSSLGNNKDEIEAAHNLFENVVINPYQEMILDAIEDILSVNKIALDLYFKTLTPIEFVDTSQVATKEKREEETGEELSSDNLSLREAEEILKHLERVGEKEDSILQEYDLVDERKVDYELEDEYDSQLKLATAPKGKGYQKSSLDGETKKGDKYLVRYQYAPLSVKNNSRDFCRAMVKLARVYRKEDLDRPFNGNKEFRHKKQPYNLFKFKGGVNCHHYFLRKTYLLKDNEKIDPNNPKAKKRLIYRSKIAEEGIKAPSKKMEPAIVSEKMIERADRGHHPNFKR